MAKKRRTRPDAQLAFDALSIEGGLLSPEWLSKVAQLAASHQTEPEYRIPKGLNLRDEIGRYWRMAQALWSELASGRAKGADAALLAERFVLAVLKDCFGFTTIARVAPITLAERVYPVGHSAIGTRVPVVIAPVASGLDTLAESFADGKRRRSAFGLVQEYLNAEDAALWGVVSDGTTLRIARDNASLTRPAWIEADLARIFAEERFADFAALWLVAHETRFGEADQPVHECPLETWREAGREQGTRARDKLRNGVEDALAVLGQGFLAQPGNQRLRTALQTGELTTKDFFNQLLRLVYRIIFLLTVEERGLLHPDGTAENAKTLYADGYSLRRLRERTVKRSAHDRFVDLWEATKIVFGGLALGEARLGLPALAGIFGKTQCPALDAAKLENRHLLFAVFKLSWIRDDSNLSRVNWRDMGPEELGSVYESLLELVPQITKDGRQFAFASGGETKGNARKTSGSYYTPDSLVQVLLDSALEPVVADTIAKSPGREVESLLGLSIVDPACGSGHFLLAAARRLAAHVARLTANGTPSAAEYRHALRQVIGHCVYGVDLNPMAVELCRVSLWMEAVEPGLPLTFLSSHIQHGNALLGTTPELMAKGIPDAAWDPIEGDDKKVASALKKRNKAASGGQRNLGLFGADPATERQAVTRAVTELEAAADADVAQLAQKESRWDGILGSKEYLHQKLVADAWCAAFVWPKQAGPHADAAPTTDLWRQMRDGQGEPPKLTVQTVCELAEQYWFFHWHLQFPHVFERGGFDVVLGNPPWDTVRFNEEEFFAPVRPDIAGAPTAAARKRMVAKLKTEDPQLFERYKIDLRVVEGANAFVRSGVTYPLCGVGRVNLFALFAEAARSIVCGRGRVGQILPSGIVSDDSTKLFFQDAMESGRLVSFFDFENRQGIFGAVHRSFKFGLLVLAGAKRSHGDASFVFFATRVDHLKDSERRFTLSATDIALLNPTTKTCPIFRSRRDAEITRGIYRRLPVLATSAWKISHQRLINQSDDSDKFLASASDGALPLYEGKFFHHYDHRWLTVDGDGDRTPTESDRLNPNFFVQPKYWYPADDVRDRFGSTWNHDWTFAWRDIARSTDERTLIASVIPSAAVPNTARVVLLDSTQLQLLPAFVANFGSFAADFVARQKIGGTHMSGFIVDQLAVPPPTTYRVNQSWQESEMSAWLLPRVLELTYTSWDLERFARDVGYDGPPFRWKPARRFLLRCELDAAFFHLYGLSRDDTDYVMDTFPIVRKNDEKAHGGKYRTKEVILEIYDAMAEAARIGKSYQTRLDPPPADPRVAHPSREGGKVIALPIKPAVRPQPIVAPAVAVVPDLAAVAANAWIRPHSMERGEIRAAIIAVLKANGAPMDRCQARLASLLCLEPHLLLTMLDKSDAAQWTRVVGDDARKAASAPLDATWREWGPAVRGLRGQDRLLEDLDQDTWALGGGTEANDTTGWHDGRAGFVVNALRRLQQSADAEPITQKLPAIVQQWLADAA